VDQEHLRIGPWDQPPEGNLVPLKQVLPDVVRELGIAEAVWQNEIVACWPELMGEQLAAKTRPGRVAHGTLVVFVEHSVWLNELSRYGKKQMLERLQARFGRQRIRSIRLQLDPGS
jgi:predicted nucleic acid-binding Zn ribbon protein